jgi:hypothetical protein
MSLLTELDAFYLEHRKCGELEIDSDEQAIWIECSRCGGRMVRPTSDEERR